MYDYNTDIKKNLNGQNLNCWNVCFDTYNCFFRGLDTKKHFALNAAHGATYKKISLAQSTLHIFLSIYLFLQ